MKPAFTFFLITFIFFLTSGLHAQTGVLTQRGPGGPVTTSDTVNAGSFICLDSTVVSCVVTLSKNGILVQRSYSYNCFPLERALRPGTKVYVTEIVSQPQAGVRVRMPDRQFYVR